MKRVILFLLLLVSSLVHAEEPITGAFGLKFGAVVDENLTLLEREDGYHRYSFEPKTPSNIFTEFIVSTTPFKRQIYFIHASGVLDSCEPEFQGLTNVLTKKYGQRQVDPLSSHLFHFWVDPRGIQPKSIELTCKEIGDSAGKYELSLSYLDSATWFLALDEIDPETEAKIEAEAGNF